MARTYAKFVALGPLLAVDGGGYALTTTADATDLNRTARCDVGQNAGVTGVEFYFYGDDAGLSAAVGLVDALASLSTYVGGDAHGAGWRLDTGEIRAGGSAVHTGLPAVVKGDLIGVVFGCENATLARIEFYLNRALVYTHMLGSTTTRFFAVSIATALAGGTTCIVNAGQWSMQTGAMRTGGWPEADATVPAVRISDLHMLTAPTDSPANARYEGVIADTGFDMIADLSFWPWGDAQRAASSVGQVVVLDADGALDAFATADVRGKPVLVRQIERGALLASATAFGRYSMERVEILDDGRKRLVLRDAHVDLDDPLQTTPILPFMSTADAWKPQPILIGACLSVPGIPISSDGALQLLCDAPLAAVSRVFEGGDDLLEGADYALDATRQQLQLVSPPVLQVLADASTIGSVPAVTGDDAWGAVGAPFAGVDMGAITGVTASNSGGTSPYFKTAAITTPPGGDGKPGYLQGVVFPNAAIGGRGWITLASTIAAGASFRYQLSITGKLLLAFSSDPADAIAVFAAAGYYEGTLSNPYGSAKPLFLITVGDGGSTLAELTFARFYRITSAATLLPATLEQTLREIFQRAGKGDWQPDDAHAIDQATGYAGIGYYTGDAVTARDVLAAVLPTYTACEYNGLDGLLRIARLIDPATADADFALDDGDLTVDLVRLPDLGLGLSKRMAYQANATVLDASDFVTDLVDVPPARRQELSRDQRGIVYSTVALAARYRIAETAEPMASLFHVQADAQAEIDRVCALYAVNRDFYQATLSGDQRRQFAPGMVCALTYARYGLDAGKKLLVKRVRLNPATGNTELMMWG